MSFGLRFALILAVFFLASCGVKAPPQPPLPVTAQESELTPSPRPFPTSRAVIETSP